MSPDTPNEIEFTLDENVEILLSSLRKLDLAWIADEIRDAILEDWLSIREPKVTALGFDDWRGNRELHSVRGMGQEAVALLVVQNYLIELFEVWNEAQLQLSEALEDKRLKVQLTLPGSAQPIVMFQPDYGERCSDFRRLLGRALYELGASEQI